jgi:hypothetical protein
MFKVGDIIKFTDNRRTSNSSWEIISDCKANVYEVRDIKDKKVTLTALGEWIVYDELYYRKFKLDKICSKLEKR